MDKELEFDRWLDNCIEDAKGKLDLSWLVIAIHLITKGLNCLTSTAIEKEAQ